MQRIFRQHQRMAGKGARFGFVLHFSVLVFLQICAVNIEESADFALCSFRNFQNDPKLKAEGNPRAEIRKAPFGISGLTLSGSIRFLAVFNGMIEGPETTGVIVVLSGIISKSLIRKATFPLKEWKYSKKHTPALKPGNAGV